jgi:hypothetical protein
VPKEACGDLFEKEKMADGSEFFAGFCVASP